MNGRNRKIIDFFGGKKQFVIPIHQRKYSWRRNEECKRLFDDILDAGRTPIQFNDNGEKEYIPYFIGSVVYKEESDGETSLIEMRVEDGQQRITTLSEIALATYKAAKEHPKSCKIEGIDTADEILDTFIINKYSKGEEYYKLILNDSDKNDWKELVDMVVSGEKINSKTIKTHKKSNIFNNFGYFMSKINKNNINDVYQGILRLQIIEIYLERYDIPQMIYETLNSTGRSLSTMDRVRNNLLMGLPKAEQEELYGNYWRSVEILFEEHNPIYADKFIRYYCIQELQQKVTGVNVYRDFKKFTNNYSNPVKVIKDLKKYAEYFMNMFFGEESDEELQILFDNFSKANPMEFSPYLLKVYDEYRSGNISKQDFMYIIKMLESYLMRRSLCGLSGNQGSDGTAVRMVRNIDFGNLVESTKEFMLNIKGNLRFISDETVRDTLENRDFCLFRKNKYVLYRLANYGKKTKIDVSNAKLIQIRRDFAIDDIYLTKIGNLTLEEIDLCMDIEADSNEEFIDKRTEKLIDLILRVWEYPTL
jgi:uncharacterized protein with ParB-like and HNH nuclease domain